MSVTRAELDKYIEDMRAYRLRQAEWLGLDPTQVFDLDDSRTKPTDPTTPPEMRITWQATNRQHLSRGHDAGWGVEQMSDDPPKYSGAVVLDWMLLQEMDEAIGEKPKFPGPNEAELRQRFGL